MVTAHPTFFKSGLHPLPTGDHPLHIDRITSLHRTHCRLCASLPEASHIHDTCYFRAMLRCLTHGWRPPLPSRLPRPRYRTNGNYPSLAQFPDSVAREMDEMIAHGVLRPPDTRQPGLTHPMGAQIKNSDKIRARVLANIDIHDQSSMDAASAALLAIGSSKVKCRMTLDPTATGLNDATPDAPFRYPSLADFIDLVRPNSYLALTDIGRYFHSFPLALDARPWFRVSYNDTIFEYARCPFGFKSCPFFCSAWSAEIKLWFAADGITTAHLMDDWLTVAQSHTDASRVLTRMEDTLRSAGFSISDKSRVSQRETILGVMVDTVSMRLLFDPVQCRGMAATLAAQLDTIRAERPADPSLVRHICGKLNWFSEILQSGRLRTARWWQYCRRGTSLSPSALTSLIADTEWWISILHKWGSKQVSSLAYAILNPIVLANDHDRVWVVQSDASGTDGYGYTVGHIGDDTLTFHSFTWTNADVAPSSSHACELRALQRAVHQIVNSTPKGSLLVWLSDSLAATYSINKGLARKDDGFAMVADILHHCDDAQLTIVAIWVPREQNQFADYLSHLSCLLHRTRVDGTVGSEEAAAWNRTIESHHALWDMVPGLVRSQSTPGVPRDT